MRFLFLLALLLSCTTGQLPEGTKPVDILGPTPEVVIVPEVPTVSTVDTGEASKPIGEAYPIANAKKVFTVKIEALNYTEKQTANLVRASVLIAKIFNSQEYRDEVLGHVYKSKQNFDSSNGLSNAQIYEKLFAGAEALIPAINYQMDLKVSMYLKKYSSVIGYTSAGIMIVYTNSKFHNSFGPCDIASNLTHEWTHKMGFGHLSASSYYSVPYAHSSLVDKLCPLAENDKLTPL